MVRLIPVLILASLYSCKKSDSAAQQECVAFEVHNTTSTTIDPLSYINACNNNYVDHIPANGFGYLTGDEKSLQQTPGLTWERLKESPAEQIRISHKQISELSSFGSSELTSSINLMKVTYWDTTKIKNQVVVTAANIPNGVNATLVLISYVNGTQQITNATFEDGRKPATLKVLDNMASQIKAQWKFWQYKYENGEKQKVNGRFVTIPLGDFEHSEHFNVPVLD